VESQQHRGWVQVEKIYEDAAESGGTLERPAMRELLADIERGRIDVVVVYKLDRLSRSLLDFVQLIDVFERYNVSFVCITQNFDTGDSLGRLVMNVLLTFAQFEREITSDRIRDKKRAMLMRGLWSGGKAPIGYNLIDHHLIISPREAEIVRDIYGLYLKHEKLSAVERICKAKGYRSKITVSREGRTSGGSVMTKGAIRKILMNPIYAGFLVSKGKTSKGVHQSILTVETWERVNGLRGRQIAERAKYAQKELLAGIICDCFGRTMTAHRMMKPGKLHVHYKSNQTPWGIRHHVKRLRVNAADADRIA
jgi:DNA invertase Pin-like site-specific DNA recombinase